MSTTVNELIIGAMRLVNIVRQNEIPSPDDIAISLQAFDGMIDSWSNDNIPVYTRKEAIFSVKAGQQSYQLGPCKSIVSFSNITPGSGYVNGTYTNVPVIPLTGVGGAGYATNISGIGTTGGQGASATVTVANNSVSSITISSNLVGPSDITTGGGFGFNVGDQITVSNTQLGGFGSGFTANVAMTTDGDWAIQRPLKIERMKTMWLVNTSMYELDLDISPLTFQQFADLPLKQLPNSFALNFYNDMQFPISTIQLFPIPLVSMNLRVFLREPLVDFSDLNAIIQYPPGYERAFRFNLACEIAAEFGKDIPEKVAAIAAVSYEKLATINSVPRYMSGDGGLSRAVHGINPLNPVYTIWAAGSNI